MQFDYSHGFPNKILNFSKLILSKYAIILYFKTMTIKPLYRTTIIIFLYIFISSLALLNKQGGADIFFFFLINFSFIIHIVILLYKTTSSFFRKNEDVLPLLASLGLTILIYAMVIFIIYRSST